MIADAHFFLLRIIHYYNRWCQNLILIYQSPEARKITEWTMDGGWASKGASEVERGRGTLLLAMLFWEHFEKIPSVIGIRYKYLYLMFQ